ncbi:putative anti-sigma factor [Pseudomonas phage vB_PF_Y1-MI]|nr:putative anti-sigma factor [Pseudomonas phage vB_PF_Y1-MI]
MTEVKEKPKAKRVSVVKPPRNIKSIPYDELEGFEKDMRIIAKLQSKQQNALGRGLDFNMTFQSMKNIMEAKKCFYTGVTLTDSPAGNKPTDRTIERVDNEKGYIIGNVVACSYEANQVKAMFEGRSSIDLKTAIKMFSKIKVKIAK